MSTFLALFAQAKWAFSARRGNHAAIQGLDANVAAAVAGDRLLGRVQSIGQHPRIQLVSGRPSDLYPGDLVVLPCGARYGPDQFKGLAEIDSEGCDLLAGGGCLGRMVARNARVKLPARVQPLGRLVDRDGRVMNLAQYAPLPTAGRSAIPVIGMVGTAMNSGKTTATAALALGLRLAGWKVAAIKGTGTGSFGDYNEFCDTGAHWVGDFTDAGMVTTYLEPLARLRAGIDDLLWAAESAGSKIAVMELADGVYQRETAASLPAVAQRCYQPDRYLSLGPVSVRQR